MKRRAVPSLAEVSSELRAEAYRRYEVIRPCLDKEVSQAEQARVSGVTHSTIERWMKQYRQDGVRGLVRQERSDKRTRRRLSEEVVKLVEGFA
jgi:putative transposase